MEISKGKYKFIKVGLGNANLTEENKKVELPIYAAGEVFEKIGKATIIEENPLILNIEFTKDIKIPGNYFSIGLMNYTNMNGCLISIKSFKLITEYNEYKQFLLSDENFKKLTKNK